MDENNSNQGRGNQGGLDLLPEVKRVLSGLRRSTLEDFYAIYLSMDKDVARIAAAAKVTEEQAQDCLQAATEALGPMKTKEMEEQSKSLNDLHRQGFHPPFGLRSPGDDKKPPKDRKKG